MDSFGNPTIAELSILRYVKEGGQIIFQTPEEGRLWYRMVGIPYNPAKSPIGICVDWNKLGMLVYALAMEYLKIEEKYYAKEGDHHEWMEKTFCLSKLESMTPDERLAYVRKLYIFRDFAIVIRHSVMREHMHTTMELQPEIFFDKKDGKDGSKDTHWRYKWDVDT